MTTLLRLLPALLLLGACDSSTLEQSCSGEAVPNCLPYEYAEITSVEVTPSGLPVDALDQELTFRVEFDKCDAAPRPHVVPVVMRVGGENDAGSGATLVTLVELRDDGSDGDAEAQDGVITTSVPNPFFGIREVPPNTDVTLVFQTRMPADCSSGTCLGGTCRSPELAVPYRTGPRTM